MPSNSGSGNTPSNLSWDSPSGSSIHSLPLGNGEIGVNVWIEPPGDVVLYIARTDAWSEQGRLLKLGRVRLTFDPAVFNLSEYHESLDVASATAKVQAGDGSSRLALQIWVDAHLPVVRIEANSELSIQMQAKVELWRTARRELTAEDRHFGLHEGPYPLFENADTLLPREGEQVVWFHRNEESIWPADLELQGLRGFKDGQQDPLLHRTFGCAMEGSGLRTVAADTLQSIAPKTAWSLRIHPCSLIAPALADWLAALDGQIDRVNTVSPQDARNAHEKWWNEFWDRSWIRLSGTPQAEVVSECYRLQRYYLACAGRGNFPIKFNGSLFTFDLTSFNPDYRRWGGGYWFQNTRLAYWPMLAAGDAPFMQSFFRLFESQLPLARFRTNNYFGHEGAYFAETQSFWGTYLPFDFGWDGKAATTGEISSPFIRWHLNGNLELLALMLGYYDYVQDLAFAEEKLIPMATEILRFFDHHYARDEKGVLRLEPGQALETYWDSVNNTPDVAGLRDVLNRLLSLPDDIKKLAPISEWQRLRQAIPEISISDSIGEARLLPAETFDQVTNVENPELYAVFPFRLFGVGHPHLETAINTYRARLHCCHSGWSQDEICAAFLGMGREAQAGLIERFASRGFDRLTKKFLDETPRFPAAWGPNFDWVPDMDHGGAGMLALQSMLLQADRACFHILPAWPADWNVDFKLWAPGNTLVEGSVQNGHLTGLTINPESRSRQVVVHDPQ